MAAWPASFFTGVAVLPVVIFLEPFGVVADAVGVGAADLIAILLGAALVAGVACFAGVCCLVEATGAGNGFLATEDWGFFAAAEGLDLGAGALFFKGAFALAALRTGRDGFFAAGLETMGGVFFFATIFGAALGAIFAVGFFAAVFFAAMDLAAGFLAGMTFLATSFATGFLATGFGATGFGATFLGAGLATDFAVFFTGTFLADTLTDTGFFAFDLAGAGFFATALGATFFATAFFAMGLGAGRVDFLAAGAGLREAVRPVERAAAVVLAIKNNIPCGEAWP